MAGPRGHVYRGWLAALALAVATADSGTTAGGPSVLGAVIVTVAGNGTSGYGGDGGPATAAALNHPFGVAAGGGRRFVVADEWNCRLRAITSGVVASVAGPAPQLSQPTGVAVDASGNVFFADSNNHRVGVVSATTHEVTTFAGTGVYGFSGDGGPATSAQLSNPLGVALDGAGNLYITDCDNNRIRVVDAATGFITTLAGDGTAGFSGDGGPATSAALQGPYPVAVDAHGNVFIPDRSNHRVRMVAAGTRTIMTMAGNGSAGFSGDGEAATAAMLHGPSGVAVDRSGNIVIADQGNHRIRVVSAASATVRTLAGTGVAGFSGDGGAATSACLNAPAGVAVDDAGNVLVADWQNSRVRKVCSHVHHCATA